MKHSRLILAACMVTVACADSTSSDDNTPGVPGGNLNTLLLPITAPELCADSAGAWFHKRTSGGTEEIALTFPEEGGDCSGETEDFLRLQLERRSLATLPNGTPINVGDSVFISVKWVGSDSVMFRLSPSGLQFTPGDEARLKIKYDKLNGDLNDDGNEDEDDHEIERRLDIYRQEEGDTLWFPVGTVKIEEEDEIEAELRGFSRFMLAY
jgi:hypothetical protein